MGTGSVTPWFLRLFRVCRRCLSPGMWFSQTKNQKNHSNCTLVGRDVTFFPQ